MNNRACMRCARKALLFGKIAAIRNFPAQQCLAGSKNCVLVTLLCRKIVGWSNYSEQQCANPATYRANSNTQTDGRRLLQLISRIRLWCAPRLLHDSLVLNENGTLADDLTGAVWHFAPSELVGSSAQWTVCVPAEALRRRQRCHHFTVAVVHEKGIVQVVRLPVQCYT